MHRHDCSQWNRVVISLLVCVGALSVLGGIRAEAQEARFWEQPDVLDALDARLQWLIATHPDSNVSQTLWQDIIDEELLLSFDFDPALAGAVAGVCIVDVEGIGLAPVLQIDPLQLLDHTIPDEILQLALAHEYVHWDQLVTGRAPAWTFLPRHAGEPVAENEVLIWFEAEVEATLYEAVLAIEMGWEQELDLCSVFAEGGELAVRDAIAERMGTIPALAPHRDLLHTLAAFPMPLQSLVADQR